MCSSVAKDIPERGVFISVELCCVAARDGSVLLKLGSSVARDIPERGSVYLC